MDIILEELGIPKKYLKSTNREDRFIAVIHKSWLRSLLLHQRLPEFNEKCNWEIWPYCNDEVGQSCLKVFIRIFKKRDAKVIPLPKVNKNTRKQKPLLFPQLMQYISQTNYKNLWKEAYKKYNPSDMSKNIQVILADYNDVLREIIIRTYGCQIINALDSVLSTEYAADFDNQSNIYPSLCGVETLNAIFLIHLPYIEHNLNDCVTFSPSILEKCYTKPLFLVYQLINTLKAMHDCSLTLGDITLDDIYLSEDLWINIFPQLNSNIYIQDLPKNDNKLGFSNIDCRKIGHKYENMKCLNCGIKTYDKVQISTESLEKLCDLWVNSQISNYTYLMSLNNLAGRKFGDPNCHYVFPWVTDFELRSGKNWRDLKKSKYRLNKGDRQLDLTYESCQTQVPHHVSDVLSSITYYVYTARRTPRTTLCKNVRTVWVPAEYPSSIQRLQEWTPDECIPEFFSDPTVFKSIHDDLDDLEVPNWCSSPEEFVEMHRDALESQYVSERLHQWIDLTFGYKLDGAAAVKSKNVCLQLVDGHTNLTSSGVVQLFTQPHPTRGVHLPFWGKTPPKLFVHKNRQKSRDNSTSPSAISIETYKSEEDDFSLSDDLVLSQSQLDYSKILPRSRRDGSKESKIRASSNQRSNSLGPKNPTFTSHISTRKLNPGTPNVPTIISLPKEFNPALALNNLEGLHQFFTKTFHSGESKKFITSEAATVPEIKIENSVQNAFTNQLFQETYDSRINNRATKSFTFPIDNQNIFPFRARGRSTSVAQKSDNQISCNYIEIISSRRSRELQILGCIILEIFMPKQLRVLNLTSTKLHTESSCNFKTRLKNCLAVLRSCKNEVPPCIKYIVNLLLQPNSFNLDNFKYPIVNEFGVPPITAHLLLEPLMHSLIPFNEHFPVLFELVLNLKEFEGVSEELNVLYHFDCDGNMCSEYENTERAKILFMQNIGECKVKSCAKVIEDWFEEINVAKDIEIIYILVQYIKKLLEDPPTSVLAAWYIFDPISRMLGPKKSEEMLLDSILKLFDTDLNDSYMYNTKVAKLYHHSFLLRLIVRFGLKCFLNNFITPLVEAVGGYRDNDKLDFVLHTHIEKAHRKTSHLKAIDTEQPELSPSDDSSESEKNVSSIKEIKHDKEPELFEFESEELEPPLQSLIEHLELNVSSDLPFNHSSAEEALDNTITENLDEINIYISDDINEFKPNLMSPTIPIPSKTKEFSNISCDIGSKKSECEYLDKKSDPNHFDIDNIKIDYDYSQSAASYASGISRSSNKSRRNEAKISNMSSDSLIWLSHRLGPVLTARHLSRNLLKMLTLCYVGKENLVASSSNLESSINSVDYISIACSRVIGDNNAGKVLECLSSIAALYGEQLILLQYLPHMSELIALCKRKLTANLEGGLISCLSLMKHIIPYICDSTLMDQLQDVILKNILHPTIRLLGSTKYTFPNGSLARNVLARKYLDTLYVLSLRMGAEMTKTHLAVPALQRFFLIFDKIGDASYFLNKSSEYKENSKSKESLMKSIEESHFIELRRDGTTTEWAIGGRPVQISHVRLKDSDSVDSLSPPLSQNPNSTDGEESVANLALDEMQNVFTSELAHTAYFPFLKQIGLQSLESSLKNHKTIKNLCHEYEKETKRTFTNFASELIQIEQSRLDVESSSLNIGSIGSNVSLIGNRIEVQEEEDSKNIDILSYVSNKMENNVRHLRGNWLAYWEHEIGRSDKDMVFNFKQIKLQTFTGHTNTVKSIEILDNENSFLSGSRDKTVKLWSLRSQGDGTSVTNCQSTYSAHKKSILSLTFLESLRLVASCDNVVHLWDPFMGANVGQLESIKFAPVNILKSLPTPSSLLFAATTEGNVRVIDARICSYTHELKVSNNPTGFVRCMAVAPSGLWVATGQTNGQVTILDTRTGLVITTWKAHESDLLQLVALNDDVLISSSLDQSISVWNIIDGRFLFHMNMQLPRGASEPVHCLNIHNNALISGTTANRIGVHTTIDADASFSSTKLRSDTFKGLLTSMTILPLNRLLLLGADTGNIHLLC